MDRNLVNFDPESAGATGCPHCANASYKQQTTNNKQQTDPLPRQRPPISPQSSHFRLPMSRGKIFRLSILVFFGFMVLGVYVTFFKHPPPDELLQMNMQSQSRSGYMANDFGASSFKKPGSKVRVNNIEEDTQDDDEEEAVNQFFKRGSTKGDTEQMEIEDDDDNNDDKSDTVNIRKGGSTKSLIVKSTHETGAEYWSQFVKENKFVTIGGVYDTCDGDRDQLGVVVLQKDIEKGGVKSVTFFNLTFGEDITGGKFYIEVKYNGQDLYDNYWELCELEEELPPANRTFNCPVRAGHWTIMKEKHIPGYLPTGRFVTKAWAVDESDRVIMCGFSDFRI